MPKYVVRYGSMRYLGVFSCRARDRYARGQRVIARTGRGQESGEVLCEATEHVVSQMGDKPHTGQILRLESHEDSVELRRLGEQERSEFETCQKRAAELGLDMKIVEVERLYGGERVLVYYLSEQRVDFRELVKLLARDLQTRIEMRQIGVRDEAKLLADYGDCGKPVCCNTHLSEMPPVSMKMAKVQRATLDPTKISGRCGRLKCCLRYEYDTYQELQRELPKVGYEVLTNDGKVRVLSQETLTGELMVETEDRRRVVIHASDVLTVVGKAPRPKPPGKKAKPADNENTPSEGQASDNAKRTGTKADRKPRGGRGRSTGEQRRKSDPGPPAQDPPSEPPRNGDSAGD
ncbi:MAG: regulatory iron-sulfur-containing complex subunit RicT [Planctomycetota bacterium]